MGGGSNPNAKHPISVELIKTMAEKINLKDDYQIELMTISSLCFYGFLRISECTSLLREDVKIEDNTMTVYIRSSKTDQDAKGVYI